MQTENKNGGTEKQDKKTVDRQAAVPCAYLSLKRLPKQQLVKKQMSGMYLLLLERVPTGGLLWGGRCVGFFLVIFKGLRADAADPDPCRFRARFRAQLRGRC